MRVAAPSTRCATIGGLSFVVIAACLVLGAIGCSAGDSRQELRVFAAASLHGAFSEIEVHFEASHPDVDVVLNIAGSASLREQALNGAPVDVIALANNEIMAALIDGEFVNDPRDFATNELTIAVPAGNPGEVASLEAFASEDLLIGLCASGVPCGDLAERLLRASGVSAAIDTRAPDVRSLVTRLQADELDAGLVYVTDIRTSDLQQVPLPAELVERVSYPIAIATESNNHPLADEFVQLVLSASGQAILSEFGFGVS